MARAEPYKLSVYGDGFRELHDMEEDPWERHNLASDPAHQTTAARLLTRLLQWQMESWPVETPQRPLAYHYRATARDLIPKPFREAHRLWQEETGITDP